MKKVIIILLLAATACTSSSDEKAKSRPSEWFGAWNAEWETPPESYPGVVDMEFYMTGEFTFTEDSLKKTVHGYPGCIFAIDTLAHAQTWYVSNDTLYLMNGPDSPGMTYVIAAKSEDRIKLQLMEDIFVTLSK